MRLLLRHKLLVAATTLVAAGSAGGAYAASQSGTSSRQAFINDVARRLHVSPAQLSSAFKGALIDRLEAAVKAGKLTQAQANRIEQRIQRGGLPFFLGERHHRFLAPPAMPRVAGPLHAAAGYLGLTDLQLLGDLRSGKSLAQIAKARDKSVSGLEQAIQSSIKSRLDRAVAGGFITKAQEERILSRLSARIGRLVDRNGLGQHLIGRPRLRALPDGPGFGSAGGPPAPGPPSPGPRPVGPIPPAA